MLTRKYESDYSKFKKIKAETLIHFQKFACNKFMTNNIIINQKILKKCSMNKQDNNIVKLNGLTILSIEK